MLLQASRCPEPAPRSNSSSARMWAGICLPAPPYIRCRMSIAEMLGVGTEIEAMPVLDLRSPHQIMDDLNAL